MSMTLEQWQWAQEAAQDDPRWADAVEWMEEANAKLAAAQDALDRAAREYQRAERLMADSIGRKHPPSGCNWHYIVEEL